MRHLVLRRRRNALPVSRIRNPRSTRSRRGPRRRGRSRPNRRLHPLRGVRRPIPALRRLRSRRRRRQQHLGGGRIHRSELHAHAISDRHTSLTDVQLRTNAHSTSQLGNKNLRDSYLVTPPRDETSRASDVAGHLFASDEDMAELATARGTAMALTTARPTGARVRWRRREGAKSQGRP